MEHADENNDEHERLNPEASSSARPAEVENDSDAEREQAESRWSFLTCCSAWCFHLPGVSYLARAREAAASPPPPTPSIGVRSPTMATAGTSAGSPLEQDSSPTQIDVEQPPGLLGSLAAGARRFWKREAVGFHPGGGYERVPLNFTTDSVPDLERGSDGTGSTKSLPPTATHGATRPRTLSLNSTTPSATRDRSHSASASPNGLGGVFTQSGSGIAVVDLLLPDWAKKVNALGQLSSVSVVVEPVPHCPQHYALMLRGPLRTDYAFKPGSRGYALVSDSAAHAEALRLEPWLFDAAKCPVTPIVAMDMAEEALLDAIAANNSRRRRVDGGDRGSFTCSDDFIIDSVHLSGLSFAEDSAATASLEDMRTGLGSRNRSRRNAVGLGTTDDDGGAVSNRGDDAHLDDEEIARRRAARKNATVSDLLPIVAAEFSRDYDVDQIHERARVFVRGVLNSLNGDVALAKVSLSDCTFTSAIAFGSFLTAPWIPDAREHDGGIVGGLRSLSVRNCGLTTAHVTALARSIRSVARTQEPNTYAGLLVVERLAIFGPFNSQSLNELLGIFADCAPEVRCGGEVSVSEGNLRSFAGLQRVDVNAEMEDTVRQHRLAATQIKWLNGQPMERA